MAPLEKNLSLASMDSSGPHARVIFEDADKGADCSACSITASCCVSVTEQMGFVASRS
jgi:hypothetical protein